MHFSSDQYVMMMAAVPFAQKCQNEGIFSIQKWFCVLFRYVHVRNHNFFPLSSPPGCMCARHQCTSRHHQEYRVRHHRPRLRPGLDQARAARTSDRQESSCHRKWTVRPGRSSPAQQGWTSGDRLWEEWPLRRATHVWNTHHEDGQKGKKAFHMCSHASFYLEKRGTFSIFPQFQVHLGSTDVHLAKFECKSETPVEGQRSETSVEGQRSETSIEGQKSKINELCSIFYFQNRCFN